MGLNQITRQSLNKSSCKSVCRRIHSSRRFREAHLEWDNNSSRPQVGLDSSLNLEQSLLSDRLWEEEVLAELNQPQVLQAPRTLERKLQLSAASSKQGPSGSHNLSEETSSRLPGHSVANSSSPLLLASKPILQDRPSSGKLNQLSVVALSVQTQVQLSLLLGLEGGRPLPLDNSLKHQCSAVSSNSSSSHSSELNHKLKQGSGSNPPWDNKLNHYLALNQLVLASLVEDPSQQQVEAAFLVGVAALL
jgi:hypothetical protein